MELLAISGSARKASTNTALLRCLADCAPAGMDVTVFDGVARLPIFSPDLEGPERPPEVTRFVAQIARTDGVIVSSPEYVRGIPGGLKNALDWLVSGDEIISKPLVLIHASHRGDDMLEALRLVLRTVTTGFNEDLFLRFALVKKSPNEVRAFFAVPENGGALHRFLLDFATSLDI